MKQIWKFKLSSDNLVVDMPANAEILSAQMQGGDICVWAICDVSASTRKRKFRVIGTGWGCKEDYGKFIDTVQFCGLVWHVFDGGEV